MQKGYKLVIRIINETNWKHYKIYFFAFNNTFFENFVKYFYIKRQDTDLPRYTDLFNVHTDIQFREKNFFKNVVY